MRRAKCGSDNREGRKFRSKSGVALARQCPRCGASIWSYERQFLLNEEINQERRAARTRNWLGGGSQTKPLRGVS